MRLEKDGSYWLPDPSRPSSHILKFETVTRVCLAEYLGLDVARRLGLGVAEAQYHQLDSGTPYLQLERYDRAMGADGALLRLHQEDMTQGLGVSRRLKYEADGGPTLRQVAEFLRQRTAQPVRDIGRLRDWQLFNYFVGNYEGHGKNLSLIYPTGGSVPVLAPFYDVVCLEFLYRINIRFARTLAFSIAGKRTPEEIGKLDWEQFAKELSLPWRPVRRRLEELAEQLPRLARDARQAHAANFADNQVLDRFEETIGDRCRWTLQVLR